MTRYVPCQDGAVPSVVDTAPPTRGHAGYGPPPTTSTAPPPPAPHQLALTGSSGIAEAGATMVVIGLLLWRGSVFFRGGQAESTGLHRKPA